MGAMAWLAQNTFNTAAKLIGMSTMKFCPKCGSILIPAGSEVVCKSCGHKEAAGEMKLFKEVKKDKKKIEAASCEVETLPTMQIKCPKCGHHEAYFWTMQTRAGDEPETQFYRCKKCNHSWRKY